MQTLTFDNIRTVTKLNFFQKVQQKLISLLLLTSFFSLISFGVVKGLHITPTFLILMIYFVISVSGFILGEIKIDIKRICLFLGLLILIFLSNLFSLNRINISSTLLYIFFFLQFVILDSRFTYKNLKKTIKIFVIISLLASIYGIYQFIAYNIITELPLKEIIPKQLWVLNMNVVDVTHGYLFKGKELIRAHSIYAEASIFSQYTAITIIFIIANKKDYNKKFIFFELIISLTSLIMSLSGTGIIILLIGFLFCFKKSKNKFLLFLYSIISAIIIVFLLVNNNTFLKYLFFRSKELFSQGYSSGFYRFVLPFEIGLKNMNKYLFGVGPGNDDLLYRSLNLFESSISNGFGKAFIELGIFGLIFLIIFFMELMPKKVTRNYDFLIILLVLIVTLNIVGSFMTVTFWAFALFLEIGTNKTY